MMGGFGDAPPRQQEPRDGGGGGSSGYVDLQIGNHLLSAHPSTIRSDQIVLVPSLFGSDLSMTTFDELREELEPVMREKYNSNNPRRESSTGTKKSIHTHIEGWSFDGVQNGAILVAPSTSSSSSSWAGSGGEGRGAGDSNKGVRLGLGRENRSSRINAPENAEDADDDGDIDARKASSSSAPPEWAPSSSPFSASDDDDDVGEVRGVAATCTVAVKREHCDADDDDVSSDGDGDGSGKGGAMAEVGRKLCRYFSIDPDTALVNGAIRFGHVALRTRPAHSYVPC
jgi:hypothetical protein